MKKILKSAGSDSLKIFLESVLEYMRMLLNNTDFMKSSPDTILKIRKLSDLINSGFKNNEILNINPELIIENIFIRMRRDI